ncbi:MAG TPA: OB-fold domain-containing protein [Stellaceae bacterium]|jgi:hypothetical protein|nr:OB-fold domain-containing protein [Stellaceae bacterium]
MPDTQPSPLAIYQTHLAKGELAYQWSPEAGRSVFYPRLVCPYSGSTNLEWRVASGLGTVYATTVTHPFGSGDPYNIVLVDCDEGFRMMSRVEDIDPMAVKIGMRVKFRVHKPTIDRDEAPYPVFTPAEGA